MGIFNNNNNNNSIIKPSVKWVLIITIIQYNQNTNLHDERYNKIINVTMSYIQMDDVYSSTNYTY